MRGGGGRGGAIALSDEHKLDRDPFGCLNAEFVIGVFRSSSGHPWLFSRVMLW